MYDDGIVLLDRCRGNGIMLGGLIGDWKKLIVKNLNNINIKFNSFNNIIVNIFLKHFYFK